MRLQTILKTIVRDTQLHAKLINTLARMEYVGARKMFKSRRAEFLDVEGLQHALEETGHALRLKRFALRLAEDEDTVRTFSDEHTLAGNLGEAWLQGVDAAAEEALTDLAEPHKTEVNYLLSSVAIELKADVFYPAYEAALQSVGAPISVANIQKDEVKHLAEMKKQLDELQPDWKERLVQVQTKEEALFECWLDALEEHASQQVGC